MIQRSAGLHLNLLMGILGRAGEARGFKEQAWKGNRKVNDSRKLRERSNRL